MILGLAHEPTPNVVHSLLSLTPGLGSAGMGWLGDDRVKDDDKIQQKAFLFFNFIYS